MWSLNRLSSNKVQILLCSGILFTLTFVLLGFAVDKIWFREDDLGTILNGIIRSWDDLIRVFSADCRSFITPANYQRTVPNVISGFLRPIQNVVFSVVYYFWGVEPQAYYLTHVAFHAANATLFFVLCSIFMPVTFSFAAGMLFAFYPDVAWLPWIGTVQNSLATFFLLLTCLLCLHRRLILAGFTFLCSLLSRESGILLPCWFFLGAYLFASSDYPKLGEKLKRALSYTWIFSLANGIYALMRLWSFGCATLPRTLRNAVLRYPWLSQYLGSNPVPTSTPATEIAAAVHQAASVATQPIEPVSSAVVAHATPFFQSLLNRLSAVFQSWAKSLFNIPIWTEAQMWWAVIGVTALVIFLCYAYRNHKALLFWLTFGAACTLWPGVLAYPSPRYINLVYPFVVFIVVYAVWLVYSRTANARARVVIAGLFCCAAGWMVGKGIYINRCSLRSVAYDRYVYKQRFDDFFERYTFDRDARFVLLSSPFVSDIQSIFQAYLGNLDSVVVFDPFGTLAERGNMGCRKEYQVTDVESEIVPIPGGFRLISHDKEHCGWWLRFSDFPIAWSPEHRAYQWMKEPYRPGVWYGCSVGSFMINGMVDDDCVYDISFVFDRQWVDERTVFVAWDSMSGEYYVVDGSHLA